MSHTACSIPILAVVLTVLATTGLYAQHGQPGEEVPAPWVRPDLWIHIQDSLWIFRYTDGDTLAPIGDERASASYTYTMAYDSTSRIHYLFTEPKINTARIPLLHWKYQRVVNAEASYLSYNSRTANFPIAAGDTVSFYREMWWINPTTQRQDPDNFTSLDTLHYSAWLVRAADTQTVALLDSMTIMPSPQPGIPIIHATQPIMAVVRFIIPSNITGDSMFIGIRVGAQGAGQFFFTRRDAYTIGRSRALSEPLYVDYLSRYGNIASKHSVEDLANDQSGQENPALRVIHVSQSEIRIAISSDASAASLTIYDQQGNAIAYPYLASAREGERFTNFRFITSGVYFVALHQGNHIIASKKLIITK